MTTTSTRERSERLHIRLTPKERELLERAERTIDDHQVSLTKVAGDVDVLDLPFAKQGAGPCLADRDDHRIGNDQTNCQGQTLRFFKTGLRIGTAMPTAEGGAHDNGPRTAGYVFAIVLQKAQASSSSSPSHSPVRSTGVTGWMVETACL